MRRSKIFPDEFPRHKKSVARADRTNSRCRASFLRQSLHRKSNTASARQLNLHSFSARSSTTPRAKSDLVFAAADAILPDGKLAKLPASLQSPVQSRQAL